MENWQKGLIAEHKITIRALEKGFALSKPLVSDLHYDFVLDDGIILKKVQVKWADQKPGNSSGAVVVNLRTRRNGKMVKYKTGDFDILLVYIPKIDKICAFSSDFLGGKTMLNVRIEPTISGQIKYCTNADDFIW